MLADGDSGVVDCDVHLVVPSVDVLLPYLSDHWRETIRETAFKGPVDTSYPRGAATSGCSGRRNGRSTIDRYGRSKRWRGRGLRWIRAWRR